MKNCDYCNKKSLGWEYDDRFCSSECAQKSLDVEFANNELQKGNCDFESLLDMDFDGSEF